MVLSIVREAIAPHGPHRERLHALWPAPDPDDPFAQEPAPRRMRRGGVATRKSLNMAPSHAKALDEVVAQFNVAVYYQAARSAFLDAAILAVLASDDEMPAVTAAALQRPDIADPGRPG